MLELDYSDAPVPVREDLPAAHRRAFARLARPGTWWSGAERIAIADAVRGAEACSLCAQRRQALSPLALEGVHDHDGTLADAAVEAIHQITIDPGRLSRAWFEKTLAAGLSDADAERINKFMKFPYLENQKGYEELLKKHGFTVKVSEDCTPHFAECVDLYIQMLTKQLTSDALRIIGWDMEMMQAMGGEMAFMSEKAHAGQFGRCRLVGVKE